MNKNQMNKEREPNAITRRTGAIAIAFLSVALLGLLRSDEPTHPVPFKGTISIGDTTLPPRDNNSVGLGAWSITREERPIFRVTDAPLELDKPFNGLLCWDNYCRDYLNPPPFGNVEFTGSASSHGRYFCGSGTDTCPTSFQFYFSNSTIVACPNDGCLAEINVKLYSRFGTVKGRVTLRDGTPVIGRTVTATDPEGVLKPVSTNTDSNGYYDFSASIAPVEPDHPAYGKVVPPVRIDPTNNWGLTVYGDGLNGRRDEKYYSSRQGEKEWRIRASKAAPSVIVNVLGGEASFANFVVPMPEEEDDPDKQDCFADGEPVSIMTGNVFFHQTDVTMQDLRGPFAFVRSYNSQNAYRSTPAPGMFGPGWSHAYESKLYFPGSFRGVVLSRSNGTPVYYTDPEDDGSFHAYLPLTEESWVVRSGDAYTRFMLDGSREVFDSDGRLIEQVDSAGGVTRLEYDGSRLARLTAPSGRSLSLSYGAEAITLSGPEGVAATYTMELGRLKRVDYPDGSGFRLAYDDLGQLLVMSDATGRVVERHTYEEDRASTSEVGDSQEKYTFRYEPGRTTVTDALGNESVYEFGFVHEDQVLTRVSGRCSVCNGTGQVREWTYDERARVVTYSDGPGRVTRYTHDSQGNVLTETNPADETTTFTYDDRGRVLSRLDPDGALTTFTYGPFGVLTTTDALERTTTVEYNGRGQPASFRNAAGGLFRLSYSELGDLTGVTDPLGRTVRYEHDDMGRQTSLTDANGNTTRFAYDPRGRLTKVTRADGSVFEVSYDKAGRRASTATAGRAPDAYLYDDAGRLKRISNAVTGSTTFQYDLASNMTEVSEPRGNVTRFQYDAFRRVTGIQYPDGAIESFVYDEAGNLTTHTDRKGAVITYLSDALGRLVGKSYSDGTPSVSYDYDPMGRLIRAENEADTLTWTYDDAGQLSSETSEANQSTIEYAYDDLGNRLSLRLDGNLLLTYDHDPLSVLRAITMGTDVFQFEHDEGYRRTSLTLPNGVTTTYAYDPASRPTEVYSLSGTTPIVSLEYSYDEAGRVAAKRTSDLTELYDYDAFGRLRSVDRTGAEVRHWAYAFDASGNRTLATNNRHVTTSVYGNTNQLTRQDPGGSLLVRGELNEPGTVEVNGEPAALIEGNRFEATVEVPPGTSTVRVTATDGSGNVRENTYEIDVDGTRADFRYDPNGNLIERTEGPTTWTFEWDGRNELERVLRDGVEVARFEYDPLGRRIQKVTAAGTISYTYDEDRILKETTSGESVLYVHGPQPDEPLAAIRDSEPTFYHVDSLGSVIRTTNASGDETSSRSYDAFGNPEAPMASGYAYTGREWDTETGLYYYRARYYDPQPGRFLSEDPIFFNGGLNLYAYVGGNPINFRDPNGTSWLGNIVDKVKSKLPKGTTPTEKELSIGNALSLAMKLYKLGKCLHEQLQCEKREGKYCRCSKNLSSAGRAYCEIQVTEQCVAASLPCYGGVLIPRPDLLFQ